MIAVILYDYFKLPVTNNRSPLVCKGHRELVIHSNTTKGQCLLFQIFRPIDSFHVVSAHAPNCLVPRDLRKKTR